MTTVLKKASPRDACVHVLERVADQKPVVEANGHGMLKAALHCVSCDTTFYVLIPHDAG
jgi:hypothetical protein